MCKNYLKFGSLKGRQSIFRAFIFSTKVQLLWFISSWAKKKKTSVSRRRAHHLLGAAWNLFSAESESTLSPENFPSCGSKIGPLIRKLQLKNHTKHTPKKRGRSLASISEFFFMRNIFFQALFKSIGKSANLMDLTTLTLTTRKMI